MAFRSDLEALVLGVLAIGDAHGYEIARKIRDLSDSALAVGDAQLYPVLHQLERNEFVEARWEPTTTSGRPPKKIYTLTEGGKSALAEHRRVWVRYSIGVAKVLRPEASHG